MSCIHIRNDVITIRVYSEGDCYIQKDKYIGIVTGYILSDENIHFTSAHGEFSLEVMREIKSEMKLRGFKQITFERHEKFKVRHI